MNRSDEEAIYWSDLPQPVPINSDARLLEDVAIFVELGWRSHT